MRFDGSTQRELLRKAELYERAGAAGDAALIGFAQALRSLASDLPSPPNAADDACSRPISSPDAERVAA